MAEQEDILIQEVNEELKAERLRQWWQRFGSWIIALCVLLVVGTSLQVYRQNQQREANQSATATLINTNEALDRKQYGAAAKQLLALPEDAQGVTTLSRLKAASALAAEGAAEKSRNQLKTVASSHADKGLAAYANLRLGDYEKAQDSPFAPLAKELQAVTLYQQGKKEEAHKLLDELLADNALPRSAHSRLEELKAAFQ